MKLEPLALDALTEIFNLGVGQAADAFSQLAGESVQLSVPLISMLSPTELTKHLGLDGLAQVSAVRQQFGGVFQSEAVLMFQTENSLQLVQMLLGTDVPAEQLLQMEQEALSEIGNILLNSVMASIADMLKITLEGHLPTVEYRQVHEIFTSNQSATVLLINIHFEVASRAINGILAFLLDMNSQEKLEQMITQFLNRLP
jgi:chemotaxis protein CheC